MNLITLTRPLFCLDLETMQTPTGEQRAVEIGFQQFEGSFPDNMTKEWRSYVNPELPIDAATQAVHGITDEKFLRCRTCQKLEEVHPAEPTGDPDLDVCTTFKRWPMFAQLAENLAKGLSNCDFAGKNIRFDLKVLASEFARVNASWTCVGARLIDADRLEQLAVPRSLSHLHEKYVGHKHDGAHGALSDVRATTTVIVRQLQEHPSLPRSIDVLHAAQFPGMIDLSGKFVFKNSVPYFANWGKYKEQPMTRADRGYWDYILRENFSADVKAIAAAAKLGNFPKETA